MQGHTMRRRFDEAETQWRKIDELLGAHKLNDRAARHSSTLSSGSG